jgi:SAM-dependent methyltransferase
MTTVMRVATARESNALAAAAGLWDALDTTQCGHPEIVERFLDALPANAAIVDVGCWNGAIAELAALRCAPWRSYTAVDIVAAAVERFRGLGLPRAQAIEGDVRALPLEDASADAVMCLFVLQDMERYRADGLRALAELARVARPDARVLLALTVQSGTEENTHYVVKKLRRRGIPEKPTHHWHGADFLAAVRAAGLRVDELHGFGPNDRGFVELYVRAVAHPAPAPPVRSVPIELLPGAPALFVDYVRDFEGVRELFAHDYRDTAALGLAVDAAAARALPREAVADVLAEQQTSETAAANVERLRAPGSVAIVTGQQPAPGGGPLYTLYKAATAVLLARRAGAVPVFWIANDDHELSAATVGGESLSAHFGRLLSRLFERDGLVVIDASDARLRRLGMPALAAELAFPSPTAEASAVAAARIAQLGHKLQVPLRPDRLSLFRGRPRRFRVRASAAGFQIAHETEPVSPADLLALYAAEPEGFSPNALLRPLYQDALLPTAAYVAGPSEIAYYAQLLPVYDRFGMQMPLIYPRKSVTLLDGAPDSLGVADVFRDVAALGPLPGLPHARLAPAGEPQERVLEVRDAADYVDELLDRLDLDDFDHQLVTRG